MHKKLFLISSLILVLSSFLYCSLYAAYESSTMGLYTFESTMAYMKLYNSDTGSWVDVLTEGGGPINGEYIVDIASGSVSNQIGAYATNILVPTGVYSKMEIKIKNFCKIKGWVKDTSSGKYYVTDADSYITDPDTGTTYFIGTTEFTGGTPSEADCEEITLTPPPNQSMDEYNTATIEFSSSVTVNEGDTPNVCIVFDLSLQLELRTIEGPGGQTLHMVLPPEQGSPDARPNIYFNDTLIN